MAFLNRLGKRPLLPVFLVLMGVLYLLIQWNNDPLATPDAREYWWAGYNLFERGTLYSGDLDKTIYHHLYSRRPIGYSVFVFGLSGRELNFTTLKIIQMLLLLCNIALVWRMANEYAKEKLSQWRLIFFCLITPASFIYAGTAMSEIVMQTLLLWSFYFFCAFLQTKKMTYVWAYNSILCIGLLVKPVFLPFLLVNILIHILAFMRYRKKLLLLAVWLPFVSYTGVSYYNFKHTGVFHFSSMGQYNLVYYNLYGFLSQQSSPQEAKALLDGFLTIPYDNFEAYYTRVNMESKALLQEHFFAYSWYHLKGSILMLFDPGRYDLYTLFELENSRQTGMLDQILGGGSYLKNIKRMLVSQDFWILICLAAVLLGNLLKLGGVFLFAKMKKIPWEIRAFVLLWIAYIVFIAGPVGVSRYMVPLFPFFLFAVLLVPFKRKSLFTKKA